MEILFLNYLFLLNQTPKEKFAIEVRSLLLLIPQKVPSSNVLLNLI